MYGLKGTAAYACHAMEAGVEEEGIYAAIHATLALLGRGEVDAGRLLQEALAVGTCNVAVMKALDAAHTARFGSPTPRAVNTAPQAGKVRDLSQ
jgi:hydroxylamine reductase